MGALAPNRDLVAAYDAVTACFVHASGYMLNVELTTKQYIDRASSQKLARGGVKWLQGLKGRIDVANDAIQQIADELHQNPLPTVEWEGTWCESYLHAAYNLTSRLYRQFLVAADLEGLDDGKFRSNVIQANWAAACERVMQEPPRFGRGLPLMLRDELVERIRIRREFKDLHRGDGVVLKIHPKATPGRKPKNKTLALFVHKRKARGETYKDIAVEWRSTHPHSDVTAEKAREAWRAHYGDKKRADKNPG